MDFQEKDYFMRYTKIAAQGLSKFMTQGSVDEILQLDEQQSGQKQEADTAKDKSEPKTRKHLANFFLSEVLSVRIGILHLDKLLMQFFSILVQLARS